ncbi:uncharacterized protein LOC117102878 isoform X4 [Anneissia japonica]|uniref:uncharacterized protein LOC117102878 isoform X4 n=1 Tax=Anneissia japonica TaxID=1529436 RepID=UPI00142569E5|nr:uncharacterized protein LOC117102878 isoform X4 [Anneissia japonica]
MTQRKLNEETPLVVCSCCKGYYSRLFFWHHKKACNKDSIEMASPLPTSLFRPLPSFVSDEFKFQILKRFRDGEIGACCREDPIICLFGKTLYTKMKRKQDKHVEFTTGKDTSMNMEESEESDDDNSLMIKRTQTSKDTSMNMGESEESDDDDNNLIIKRTQTSNTETDAIGKRRQCTRASRPYTRWSKQNTTIVVKYFRKWIDGDCLPRKKEIQLFMTRNPTLKVTSWQVIRTKVLNEQRAANKRLQKHLRNVQE